MRKWLKRQAWSVCWDLADTFWGWSMKFSELDYDNPGGPGWTKIDIHANCQPKPTTRTINLRWDPQQGLVEYPQYSTSTNGYPVA